MTASEVEKLEAALLERDAKLRDFVSVNAKLREQIAELQKSVAFLSKEVRRLLSSRRASDALDPNQALLFPELVVPSDPELPNSMETSAPSNPTPERKAPDPTRAPKKRRGRINLSGYEREVRKRELPLEQRVCPVTGVELQPVGVKIVEELEFQRAKLFVIEHQCVVYGPPPEIAAQRRVDTRVAEAPPRAVVGCIAGAGLLAHLAVSKFGDHLPGNRQSGIFGRAGESLPRQTISHWLVKAAFELEPIVTAMLRTLSSDLVVLIDDTPMKCQGKKPTPPDEAKPKKKRKPKEGAREKDIFQGYLWALTNPRGCSVVYRFTTGRGASELAPHLRGLEARYVVGDGYAGTLAALEEAGLDVIHAGCWAHAFRYLEDAEVEAGNTIRLMLTDIRALFDIENEATAAGLDADGRRRLRREKSRSIVARIFNRTRAWRLAFSHSGKVARAMKYLRNGRRSFLVFLENGNIPLDNNTTERAMRPVAMGRHNYLFVGSERGGEAAAIYYSLITSCKLIGVDPEAYLKDVFGRLAVHPASRIVELTPQMWADARREEASRATAFEAEARLAG